MLSQVNQISTPAPQMPLALLRPRSNEDWWRAETDEIPIAPRPTPVHPLCGIPLAFVRRLAADDRLRDELQADPAGILARHGVYVSAKSIPVAVSLPSSRALYEALRANSTDEDASRHIFYLGFLGGLLEDLLGDLLGGD